MSVNSVHLAPQYGFSKWTQTSINLVSYRGVEGDAHFGRTVQHLYDKKKNKDKLNLKQVHLFPLERLQDPTFRADDRLPVLPGEMGESITTEGIDLHDLGEDTTLQLVDADCMKRYTLLKRIADVTKHRSYNVFSALFAIVASVLLPLHYRILAYGIFLPLFLLLIIIPTLARWMLWAPVVRVTGLRQPCKQIDEWRMGLLQQCYEEQYFKTGRKLLRKKRRAGVMGIVERGGKVTAGMEVIVEEFGRWKEMHCV